MKRRLPLLLALAQGLVLPGAVLAHHSTEALFDRTRTVDFTAILNRVDIINPHSWWRFDEYRDGQFVREWSVEGAAPSQIRRAIITGFGSLEFEVGKKYIVTVMPGRDNEADGYLKTLVFPDGTVFTCC